MKNYKDAFLKKLKGIDSSVHNNISIEEKYSYIKIVKIFFID